MTKSAHSSGKKRLSTYDKHVKKQQQIKWAFYIGLGLILLVLIVLIILSE